jgi:hypothetical protein
MISRVSTRTWLIVAQSAWEQNLVRFAAAVLATTKRCSDHGFYPNRETET